MPQRMLVLVPPYGTAFMFAPSNGGPHNIWLMYDSDSDEEVIRQLKGQIEKHEREVKGMITAFVPPPVPAIVVIPPAQAVLQNITNMSSGHDWGQPYKLGLVCQKCGQKATGLERSCTVKHAYQPQIGDQVKDRLTGAEWEVESGEGDRWFMKDGPVLTVARMEFIPTPDPPKES